MYMNIWKVRDSEDAVEAKRLRLPVVFERIAGLIVYV
jgi:hypothetical protein